MRRQLSNSVRALGATNVQAVISTWLFLDVYGACGEHQRVYWWQDDPAGAAEFWGFSAERLIAAEERLARSSDLIVAVNEGATLRWRERGLPAEYLPNGCDAALFAGVDDVAAAADVDAAGADRRVRRPHQRPHGPRVARGRGRFRHVAAADRPEGPGVRAGAFARLAGRRNVNYLGTAPFEDLPSYLKLVDVGLVPYRDNEFNQLELPDEDARVPRGRPARRLDARCPPCAGSTPS